jgi:hypothetical protein
MMSSSFDQIGARAEPRIDVEEVLDAIAMINVAWPRCLKTGLSHRVETPRFAR